MYSGAPQKSAILWRMYSGAPQKSAILWRTKIHAPQNYAEMANPIIGRGPHHISVAHEARCATECVLLVAHVLQVRHRKAEF